MIGHAPIGADSGEIYLVVGFHRPGLGGSPLCLRNAAAGSPGACGCCSQALSDGGSGTRCGYGKAVALCGGSARRGSCEAAGTLLEIPEEGVLPLASGLEEALGKNFLPKICLLAVIQERLTH